MDDVVFLEVFGALVCCGLGGGIIRSLEGGRVDVVDVVCEICEGVVDVCENVGVVVVWV